MNTRRPRSLTARLQRPLSRGAAKAIVLCLLGGAFVQCASRLGSSGDKLTTYTTATYWISPNSNALCFYLDYVTDGSASVKDPKARELFRCAVERTWQAAANITFTGWNTCPTTGSQTFLAYAITNGGHGGISGTGKGGTAVTPPVTNNLQFVGTNNPPLYNVNYMLGIAHEVGHSLGFIHEPSNQDNRYPDGGPKLWPDGGPQWCANIDQASDPYNSVSDLTPVDRYSIMGLWSAGCGDPVYGLSPSDISGVQSIYGSRAVTADSDQDGVPDYADNCPMVRNVNQADSNHDAAREVAVNNGWNGSSYSVEGDPPKINDTTTYIDHWRMAYAGDACDPTPSTALTVSDVSSNVDSGSCLYKFFGNGTYYEQFIGTCASKLVNGKVGFDGYVSSPSGLQPYTGNGTSRPAFCRCDPGVTSTCKDLNGLWKCEIGNDTVYPDSADKTFWKQMTQEKYNAQFQYYFADVYGNVVSKFDTAAPCWDPSTSNTTWNAFANGSSSDVARVSLPSATSLTAMLWGHVVAEPANVAHVNNLENTYRPVTTQTTYGEVVRWTGDQLSVWDPFPNFLDFYGWGEIDYMAISNGPSGAGPTGLPVVLSTTGVSTKQDAFTSGALAGLASMATGGQQLVVADDRTTGANQFGTTPFGLLVDAGTTRIRGALVRSGLKLDLQNPGTVSTQSNSTLRAYASSLGKLYSLEALTIVTRDVTATLAGSNPTATSQTISGISLSGTTVYAIAWDSTTKLVYAVYRAGTTFKSLRIAQIDPTTGVASDLWSTTGVSASGWSLSGAYLSISRFGDLVLSLNLTDGTYEVLRFRTDGQPTASLSGTGSMPARATSDGSGLTVPLSQTRTETQANARLEHHAGSTLLGGVCGTTWFKARVGNQAGTALGNPSYECQ